MTAEETLIEAQLITARNAKAIRAACVAFADAVAAVERCRNACEEAQLRALCARSSSKETLLRLAAIQRTDGSIVRAAAQRSEARGAVDPEDRARTIRRALLRNIPPAMIGISPAGGSHTRN